MSKANLGLFRHRQVMQVFMVFNGAVRTVRLLLLVLLSFAIPMVGYAGLGVSTVPCPMDAAAMGNQSMSNMDQDTMQADCCNDIETMVKTGKPCKVGQECKVGTLGLLIHSQNLTADFQKSPRMDCLKERTVALRWVNIWRPPA